MFVISWTFLDALILLVRISVLLTVVLVFMIIYLSMPLCFIYLFLKF